MVAAISNSSAVARTALLLAAPRVTQALFAACLDYHTWRLAQQLYGTESRCTKISVRECESLFSFVFRIHFINSVLTLVWMPFDSSR